MSDLNNKHLPSDIDSLTRKDLVEIYHIHVEEMQTAQKRIAEFQECLLEYVNATERLWTGSNELEVLEEKATVLLAKGGAE